MKASIWKWLILVVATAWSVALVTPPKDKVKLGLDLQGGTSYTLEIDDSQGLEGSVADARDRALEVVRNRVDSMGVAEPTIYPDGEKRIVVQIPGMKAEERAKLARYSADCYAYCMVAAGQVDVVIEAGLQALGAPHGTGAIEAAASALLS